MPLVNSANNKIHC